jgi:LysR family transcriptional regulator, nod-box dependent transcriptional activator
MRFRDLDLDLNLLVVLDALLTIQNVSRAAERLNLTQPAISSSLGRLRLHFKDDLLVKRGRRMVPTALAESLRTPVRDILTHIQQVADARPNFDPASATHSFVVVASDYVAATLLADAVSHLQRVAPNVTIVSRPLTEQNIERFVRGDWDLLIMPRIPAITSLESQLLFREQFTCIAWSKNKAVGSRLTLKQYLSLTHVIVAFDYPMLMGFDEVFLRQAGHHRHISAVVPNFTLLPMFVVGTNHLATVHRRVARRFAKALPLKIVKPPITFPEVEENMCWHRHRERDTAGAWLRRFLSEVAITMS